MTMTSSTRRKRKEKAKRRQLDSTPSGPAPHGNNGPSGAIELHVGTKKLVTTDFFVAAKPHNCFALITAQLEETPAWDPMIIEAKPLSPTRYETGATSRLVFDLGGRTYSTVAMISLHHTNSRLAWVSNDQVKVAEQWRLKPKSRGTLVSFALHYEFPGPMGWLRSKLVRRSKVEEAVGEMARRLKSAAEGNWV